MEDISINIGIATDGIPICEPTSVGTTFVRNVRIGLGFHWERVIECEFPGQLIPLPASALPYTLINRVPLETYLECVVGSEMSPESPTEFLRAHAIVSRSWAAGKLHPHHPDLSDTGKTRNSSIILDWEDDADHSEFHLCNDDHCQRYQGLQPISEAGLDAIRSTRNIVLTTPSGRLVDARFSKCCGGVTERFSSCWQDAEPECLDVVEDPWCDLSQLSESDRELLLRSVLKDYDRSTGGGYRWQRTVYGPTIRKALIDRYKIDIGDVTELIPLKRGASGRITLLRIVGTNSTIKIGKELTIRRILDSECLYSSAFEVVDRTQTETGYIFSLSGRGWGHGVGMCQIGAANMALAGHSHSSILSHYYPGSHLTPLTP